MNSFRLEDDLGRNDRLQNVNLHSAIGKSFLERGFRLVQEAFRNAARAHWPKFRNSFADGPHLVQGTVGEMREYFKEVTSRQLWDACPHLKHPDALQTFLTSATGIPALRNSIFHQKEEVFRSARTIDRHLRDVQYCLLLFGDRLRAKAARVLRDRLVEEAERKLAQDDLMEGFASLPLAEEPDWDFLTRSPEPEAWVGLVEVDEGIAENVDTQQNGENQ